MTTLVKVEAPAERAVDVTRQHQVGDEPIAWTQAETWRLEKGEKRDFVVWGTDRLVITEVAE